MELNKKEVINIIQESWKSDQFKKDLLDNPSKTLKDFIGENFSSSKNIIIEDQSNESIVYLNIPHKPNFEDVELNEQQLEFVAGGGPIKDFFVTLGNSIL